MRLQIDMKFLLISALIFVCCITACATSFAKCPIQSINISGKVLYPDNMPISGAYISVFIDDKVKGFYSKSNSNGDYAIPALYDTYSETSFWGEDQCKHIPFLTTIVVMLDGHWPVMVKKDIKNISLDQGIFVEAIILDEKK